MKNKILFVTLLAATIALTACDKDESTAQPPATAAEPTQPVAATPSGTTGTVVETMNAGGYTYVYVDSGTKKIWAAAPQFSVAVGDEVMVPEGMAMENYRSQTLNRDFEVVYFVDSVLNASNPVMVTQASAGQQLPEGHPPISGVVAPPEVDLSAVQKADGGMVIADIYATKTELSGKPVTIRGKVVKFSPQIMGTNWIHIQDGSGNLDTGNHNMTVTSNTRVSVGDTVVASGPLTINKDFGYGYKYDLIMEGATVVVE